jgi:hypothetical protein
MTDEEIKRQFIRISPSGNRLEVETISWDGPHTPTSAWVDFGPIPKNADTVEIDAVMETALANTRFFRRCETCKMLKPLGWMHDAKICQGCAERDLGVVH